ncbi:hypothetical protein CsSME_00008702 [Camellia sinensis var. sinensis]
MNGSIVELLGVVSRVVFDHHVVFESPVKWSKQGAKDWSFNYMTMVNH